MIAAIISARTGSTRLPNKVLLDISGKTALERMIERVKNAKTLEACTKIIRSFKYILVYSYLKNENINPTAYQNRRSWLYKRFNDQGWS